jgi:hypothetical protein
MCLAVIRDLLKVIRSYEVATRVKSAWARIEKIAIAINIERSIWP